MKSLAKNSIWNMIYQAASVLFPLLSYMYVSRVLFADGVGKVADIQNTVAYFAAIVTYGLPEYAIRSIARYKDDIRKRDSIFTELLLLNTLFTTIVLLLFIICVMAIPDFKRELRLYFGCGMLIVFNYFNIDWFFQGMEEYGYIVGRNLLIKLLSILSLFVFVRSEQDLLPYAMISTIAMGGIYLFNAFYIRGFIRLDFRNMSFVRHMKPILVLMTATLMGNIYHQVDITMLGILKSDANVGYYVYGSKIVLSIVQICNAIPAVFLPRFAYYYQNDRRKFEELIKRGIQILVFLTLPVSAALYVLAPGIVELFFGASFLPAAATIRWLVPTIIVRSFGNLLCYELMLCTGNEKKRLPAFAAATISNVILNAVLIPRLAENGAAIATVVCEFIVNGYQLNYIRRHVNIWFEKKALIQSVVSTAVMTVSIVAVNSFAFNGIIQMCLSVFIGCLVYICMNLIMHNSILCMAIDVAKRSIFALKSKSE